jgi:hypothetical protein
MSLHCQKLLGEAWISAARSKKQNVFLSRTNSTLIHSMTTFSFSTYVITLLLHTVKNNKKLNASISKTKRDRQKISAD